MKKALLKDGIFLMVASSSLEYFGWGLSDPFFSIFANEILNNYFYFGLLIGIKNFTALLVAIPASQSICETSPRSMAIFGKILTIIFALGFFLAGLKQSIVLLFIAQIISGIAQPLRDVAEQDFLIEHIDRKKASRIMGFDFFTKKAFWLLSCSASGFVLFGFGFILNQKVENLIFYNFLFLILTSIFAIYALLKIKTPKKKPHLLLKIRKIVLGGQMYGNFFRGFKNFSLQLNFSLILFFLISMLERMISMFVPLLAFELNLKFWQIGLLLASLWLPYLCTFGFSILADKFDRLSIIICGLLFSLLPLVILSLVKAPLYIGIFSAMIALSIAFIQPANLGIVASLAPSTEKAHIAGLEFFFCKIGIIFGSIILGFVAEKFGLRFVFMVMAFLALIFAIMAIFVKFEAHRKNIHNKHNKVFKEPTYHHIFHHTHILR